MFTPVQPSVPGTSIKPKTVQQIACVLREGRWFIGAAGLLHKSQRLCSEMAAYTDELLAWIGRKRKQFVLLLDTMPFEGARLLELEELCTDERGGAYYRVLSANGARRLRIWVCDTSLLVFGDLPPRIFFRYRKQLAGNRSEPAVQQNQ